MWIAKMVSRVDLILSSERISSTWQQGGPATIWYLGVIIYSVI